MSGAQLVQHPQTPFYNGASFRSSATATTPTTIAGLIVAQQRWMLLFAAAAGAAVLGGEHAPGGGNPKKNRPRPRTRTEVAQERCELLERTNREIDSIVAEYHELLPRGMAKFTGAIYARYSTRHQDSIADQVREMLKEAVRQHVFVPREMIFFDVAKRGYTKNRAGLNALKVALLQKKVSVLLLFATNRVFRKVYRTLEFVDIAYRSWGIRCLFIKSGVDTNDTARWESLLHMNSIVDQMTVQMYVGNIRGAQEGLFRKQLVFVTLSLGYRGEPIPGQLTRRKRPRCRIVIDEETAEVVRQIFTWYVVELHSIDEIIRRLNDGDFPLPPRTTIAMWSRLAVRGILTNSSYIGLWRYGVTESVYPARQRLYPPDSSRRTASGE